MFFGQRGGEIRITSIPQLNRVQHQTFVIKFHKIALLEGRQSVAVTKWQFGEYSKRTQLTRPILNLVNIKSDVV